MAVLLWSLILPSAGAAQTDDWRTHFAAGEEARQAGDAAVYAREMAAAVAAMPEGQLNRPFAQYHSARAAALLGDAEAVGRFFQMALEEDIEALMISFADVDEAFDGVRQEAGYRRAMEAIEEMTLSVSHLGGSVYLVDGAGSKVLVSVGDDGALMVDTGYGAAGPAMERALAGLGVSGVDRLVLTHPHEDHWGMAPVLGASAEVWGHPGTRAAMEEPYTFMDDVVLDPKPESAWPDVEVAGDTAFTFNGEEVVVFGVEAHTGADLAVHFSASGVLHLGDAYLEGNPMMFPGGEDPDGFLTRLEGRLRAMPRGTVVVGGHDDPVDVGTVLAQMAETRACMALVRRALADGKTAAEAAAEAEGRFAPQWVAYFHRILSGA